MKITKQKSILGNVEEYIFEHCEDFDITQYDVMMDPEDKTQGLIGVSGVRTVIDSLDISVREGIFFNYNEEDNTWDGDFAVTLVYEKDEKDPGKYLYWEQDGQLVSIYNYLRSMGVEISKLKDLEGNECVIEFEEEDH